MPGADIVFRRFPLVILMLAAFSISVLYNENFSKFGDVMGVRLFGGFVFAAYIALMMALISERREAGISIIWQLLAVIAALLASWFFLQVSFWPPIAITAVILFLGNAPFFRQGRDDERVWDFTHKLWTAVLFTTAGSIIFTIGILSISFAVKTLLSINIKGLVEDWILPIGLSFLAPLAFLSMLPEKGDDDSDSLRNPGFISKAVGFLGTWILAPLTLVYAMILVLYGVKIIMSMSLPDGEIAKIVTPFLIVGTLTWLILDPPFIQKKTLARWFSRVWFPVSIPAAILLAFAVFVRISQYGWTLERYLLVLAAIWALGIAIWYIVKRQQNYDIRIIPGFAAILLAIASIGPWGADGFSALNQKSRLIKGLQANQMLENSKLAKTLTITDQESALNAKAALAYLLKRRKYTIVQKLLPEGKKWSDFACRYSKDEITYDCIDNTKIYETFGLDKVKSTRKLKYDYLRYDDFGNPIKISGYDYISRPNFIHFLDISNTSSRANPFVTTQKIGEYKLTADSKNFILTKGSDEIRRINIKDWLLKWPTNAAENEIMLNPYITLLDKDGVKISLYINSAMIGKDKQAQSGNLNYVILTKNIEIEKKNNTQN